MRDLSQQRAVEPWAIYHCCSFTQDPYTVRGQLQILNPYFFVTFEVRELFITALNSSHFDIVFTEHTRKKPEEEGMKAWAVPFELLTLSWPCGIMDPRNKHPSHESKPLNHFDLFDRGGPSVGHRMTLSPQYSFLMHWPLKQWRRKCFFVAKRGGYVPKGTWKTPIISFRGFNNSSWG